MIAEELVSVQPMDGIAFNELAVSHKSKPDRFGDLAHFFAYGYKVYDGNDFIYLEEFFMRYPDLNYEYLCSMNNCRPFAPEEYAFSPRINT
jgi:hypothetical protein